MKMKKYLLAAALVLTGAAAQAQETDAFKSHWFLQLQAGGAYTLGEADFDKLISPAAQVAVGYQFTPAWALRLGVNGWESKGGFKNNDTFKWNHITPALDVKFNLVNAIAGYDPTRVFGFDIIAGVGANIGWNNKDVCDYLTTPVQHPNLTEIWSGTKVRPVGRVGLDFDFNVSRRVSLNLEGMSNFTSEPYNSKRKHEKKSLDWYFSAMLGLKIKLGSLTPAAAPVPVVVEEPAPAPVVREVTKPQPTPARVAEMQTEVFYYIRQTAIRDDQRGKVTNLINFLKANPETRVTVTGYADVETGNPRVNLRYSQQRAEGVAKALTEAGINAARITVDAKGDTVQPFSENDKNRVSICIAK